MSDQERRPLTSVLVPVDVFVIFVVHNQQDFTVTDAMQKFKEVHPNVELSYNRMNQILQDLCTAEKLTVNYKPAGAKNKLTAHYSFNKFF